MIAIKAGKPLLFIEAKASYGGVVSDAQMDFGRMVLSSIGNPIAMIASSASDVESKIN